MTEKTLKLPSGKNKENVPVDTKDMFRVAQVMMFGDPSEIAALSTEDTEIKSGMSLGVYHAAESAKPALRRAVNKVTDTTLGTAVEKLAAVGCTLVCGYMLFKGAKGKYSARKERKLAEATAEAGDNLLDD